MPAAPVLQCPSCKEYISSDAKSCRFCHTPLDERTVAQAVATQAKENSKYRRGQYQKHMLIGIGLFFLGLVITIGTYAVAASSQQGGHYFITYGLIISGALDFLYGLFGWIGELRSKE
ncbi:MAG TPA: zinc ribbon domain-containing protein [Pyrinomonadaceae bacterium]|jgi:hypothetical protein|nr:zinc ribbon domain-containing protein [Pyrinomonadaceae bacterium]